MSEIAKTVDLHSRIEKADVLKANAAGITVFPEFICNATNRGMELLDKHDIIEAIVQASPAAKFSARVFMGNYFSGTTEKEALEILARLEIIAKEERVTLVLGRRDLGYVNPLSIIEPIHTGKVGDKITKFMRKYCKPVGFFPVAIMNGTEPELYRVIVSASGFNKKWIELAQPLAEQCNAEDAENDTCFEISHKLWTAYLDGNTEAGNMLFRTEAPESMFWSKPEELEDFIQCVGKHVCSDDKFLRCTEVVVPGTENTINPVFYTIPKSMFEGGPIPVRAYSYILDKS